MSHAPDGYAAHLLIARRALDELEHLAAMVASGHGQHLAAAIKQAETAVLATRSLAVWCQNQHWGSN